MGHISPFTDWIADEWDRLVQLEPAGAERLEPPEEQVAGWRAFHERTRHDGQWTVSAWDASLVTNLGIHIAWRQRRFEDAAELARRYLAHPEGKLAVVTWIEMSGWLGAALIASGQIEAGVHEFERLLSGESRGIRLVTRGYLVLLFEIEPDRLAEPAVCTFVSRLFTNWKGHKRKAMLPLQAKTYGDLLSLIEATYA